MICEAGDVVVVPFPFSDLPQVKFRPAVVVSNASSNEGERETLMAMVTTAASSTRPGDTPIVGLAEAGLKSACVMRLKLFTLDNRLIARKLGVLSPDDRRRVGEAIGRLIAI